MLTEREGYLMNIKKTLIGLTIFGAGTGVGYLIAKKTLVTQYREDLEEVKQFYYNKLEEMGVMDKDFKPENDYEEDTDGDDIETEEYFNKVMKYSSAVRPEHEGKGRPIINYNKPPLEIRNYGDLDGSEEEEDDEEEDPIDVAYEAELEARAEEFATRRYENKTNGLPYVIDHTEYEDGPEEYERQILYYYTHDRMLCEDDDSVVEDEEELTGFDYEDTLEMQTTAWVRNDKLMVLYEIHRIDASYQLTVEAAIETPREREFRILGRRKQALDD
jgi:hypothetical protein